MTFYIIRCYYKDDDDREKYYDLQSINDEIYIKLNNTESILYKNADVRFNQPYSHIVSIVTNGKIKKVKEDDYTEEIRNILSKIKNIEEVYLYSKDNMRNNYTDDDFGIYIGKAMESNKIVEGYLYKGNNELFTITEKGGTIEYPVYANSIYSKKEIIGEISKPYPFISLEMYMRMALYAPSVEKIYIFMNSNDLSMNLQCSTTSLMKMLDDPKTPLFGKDLYNYKINGIRDIQPGSFYWETVYSGIGKKEEKEAAKILHTVVYIEELDEKEKILLSLYPELLDTKRDEIFKSFWGENKYKAPEIDSDTTTPVLSAIFAQNLSKEAKIAKDLRTQKNTKKQDYNNSRIDFVQFLG